jgi:hypothetical protein
MSPEPPALVFASYSRKDAVLVQQLLRLFEAVDVPVFRDEQSIKPGQKWRLAVNAALEQCQIILIFWCDHAARSSEVQSEYERAISLGKRVMPVLIDHAALPPGLGQYQGVDLRETLSEHHERFIDMLALRHLYSHVDKPGSGWASRGGIVPDYSFVDNCLARASQRLKSSLAADFGEYTP